MVYAPVLIPTLNRADHLKRCLDSLCRNTGAEQTELYISVDYPPAEKYVAGYQKLKAMLQEMDLSVFREVHIFYQEENLGSVKNTEFLYQQAEQKYDRYIYTEDDNEFSPNFLEYMSQGLELYRDDPKMVGICGAKDTNWKTGGKDVVYTKLFAAYGIGGWFEKRRKNRQSVPQILVPDRIYGPGVMRKLLKQNTALFTAYVLGVLGSDRGFFWPEKGQLRLCDSAYSMYMHLTDRVCVAPAVAKSRTWGNDGSGENMAALDIDVEKTWPLDTAEHFSYGDVSQMAFLEENYAIGSAYLPYSRKALCKAMILYGLMLLCGRDRNKTIAFINKLRRRAAD